MSKSPTALKAIQESLQNSYKILKATDEHLQFIFLTGVTKFAKLSIFSALNSPDDITIDESYAAIHRKIWNIIFPNTLMCWQQKKVKQKKTC
jgi:hypothetical protein